MALKTQLTDREKHGLTEQEIKLGTRYLRKHKTAGVIKDMEAHKLFELFMIGMSFSELAEQHGQYPIGQIILTASLKGWVHDREKMIWSLKDRIKSRVVKSYIEQVDFLTSMLSVNSAEHLVQMRNFILDPDNNPIPDFKIKNLKEYQTVAELLLKLSSGGNKTSPLFDILEPSNPASKKNKKKNDDEEEMNPADLMSSHLGK